MKNNQGNQNSHFHGAWLIRHMGNLCERQQKNMKSRGKMEGGSINKVYNIWCKKRNPQTQATTICKNTENLVFAHTNHTQDHMKTAPNPKMTGHAY